MPALMKALEQAAVEKPLDPLTFIANFMLKNQEGYEVSEAPKTEEILGS